MLHVPGRGGIRSCGTHVCSSQLISVRTETLKNKGK
jgi:hypothetical protein